MKLFKSIVLVFFAVCLFLPNHNAAASPAKDQLKITIDQVLNILGDPSLKGEEHAEKRKTSLNKVINERFSFYAMSQGSLARHWKKRSREEKKNFSSIFGKLLSDIYISKIEDTYTDEEVEYLKEIEVKKYIYIYTNIVTETDKIDIIYKMFKTKAGKWMVSDIKIKGVSLVGNYRSQFNKALQKDSYEKLVEDLKKKI